MWYVDDLKPILGNIKAFRTNNKGSIFSPNLLDNNQAIGTIEYIIERLHVVNKCPNLNTLDKCFIYAGGGGEETSIATKTPQTTTPTTFEVRVQHDIPRWTSHCPHHSTLEFTQLYQSPPDNSSNQQDTKTSSITVSTYISNVPRPSLVSKTNTNLAYQNYHYS